MPCYDPRDQEEIKIDQERLNLVTRLLCNFCRQTEEILQSQPARATILKVYDKLMREAELTAWWKEHKAFDEARIKSEMEIAIKNEKIRHALSKLSNEDKKLLGL